jgi:DNA topoisomerase-6 subunit B
VEEIRRALIQAGQKLSRHIRKETKEADLERKLQHIEQFAPILVESLVRITKSNEGRKKRAEEGLKKLLGRDSKEAIAELEEAEIKLAAQKSKEKGRQQDAEDAEEESAPPAKEKPGKKGEQAAFDFGEESAAKGKAKKAGSKKGKK